jgi:hypothetical protein
MALFGVRWWFAFEDIALEWMVEPVGVHGVNNLMGDMGGLFFGTTIMIALGLRAGHSVWLRASALLMGIVALGRLQGYATLGFVPETVVPLVFEIVSCGILVWTHMRMSAEHSA